MASRPSADAEAVDISSSWYSKLESRWAARRAGDSISTPASEGMQLRRVPTGAERVIAAPRAAVWAAANDEVEEDDPGWHQHIVGAPASGVGARHVHVGPPLPPFGMRSVIYAEITAQREGHWYTSQTLAGTWEHKETLMLEDTKDGQTLARISGWWTKPARPTSDFTVLQAELNGLAVQMLDRIANRVEGTAGDGPSDVVG